MPDLYSAPMLGVLAVGLVVTGAVAGILAGLLGVGGGIVIVPVLFLLFDALDVPAEVAMHLAVGTSLATIIPTSISSARSHHAKGAIDVSMLRAWAPFICVGALAGGIASRFVSSAFLTVLFGLVALVVAINMALPRRVALAQALPAGAAAQVAMPGGIGLLSALMGIGGGTLTVPILSLFSY
ncbi:MAG: sulfite exporter TauE/SafE family protein, partial [Pseudomonadota bacterium]